MVKTAFLGLGVMGYPMAGHLANGSFDTVVYNRTSSVSHNWQAQYSGTVASNPAEAVASADLVFMCLGNDDDVRSVVYGDNGVVSALQAGAVLVDHTTTSADIAHELAQACAQKQASFLDAPVSGGQSGAENGMLTVMVGGDAKALAQADKALSCYSQAIQLMGATGSGQLSKMVNQICIAGVLQGLSEGLHFAIENNLNCDALLSTISKGAAQSWQMENRGTSMVANEFDFGFSVKWMIKDLRFCLEQAQRQGADLPMTAQVYQRYLQIQQQGNDRLDTSALITLLTKQNKD